MSLRSLPEGQSLKCAQLLTVHTSLFCLSQVGSPRSRLQDRIWVQVVYWGSDSLEALVGETQVRRGRKEAIVTCIMEYITPVSNWHSMLLEISRRQYRTCVRVVSPGGQGTAICHCLRAPLRALNPQHFCPHPNQQAEREPSERQPQVFAKEHPWQVLQCWVLRGYCQGLTASAAPSIISFTPPWLPTRRYHSPQLTDEKTQVLWG